MIWQSFPVYIDDFTILRNVNGQIRTDGDILWVVSKAGLTLNLEKRNIFLKAVDFLSHMIRPDILDFATKNIDAFKIVTSPTS